MKYEYEGPMEITHQSDDWGTVYVEYDPDERPCSRELGSVFLESLGMEHKDYEWTEKKFRRVRIVVEVIEP